MSFLPSSRLGTGRGGDSFLPCHLRPSRGEREEEQERRTAGRGEEEGRMKREDSYPRQNGEDGDFFSLLLGNHMTGLQTPRGEIEEDKNSSKASVYRSISSSRDKGERIGASPTRTHHFLRERKPSGTEEEEGALGVFKTGRILALSDVKRREKEESCDKEKKDKKTVTSYLSSSIATGREERRRSLFSDPCIKRTYVSLQKRESYETEGVQDREESPGAVYSRNMEEEEERYDRKKKRDNGREEEEEESKIGGGEEEERDLLSLRFPVIESPSLETYQLATSLLRKREKDLREERRSREVFLHEKVVLPAYTEMKDAKERDEIKEEKKERDEEKRKKKTFQEKNRQHDNGGRSSSRSSYHEDTTTSSSSSPRRGVRTPETKSGVPRKERRSSERRKSEGKKDEREGNCKEKTEEEEKKEKRMKKISHNEERKKKILSVGEQLIPQKEKKKNDRSSSPPFRENEKERHSSKGKPHLQERCSSDTARERLLSNRRNLSSRSIRSSPSGSTNTSGFPVSSHSTAYEEIEREEDGSTGDLSSSRSSLKQVTVDRASFSQRWKSSLERRGREGLREVKRRETKKDDDLEDVSSTRPSRSSSSFSASHDWRHGSSSSPSSRCCMSQEDREGPHRRRKRRENMTVSCSSEEDLQDKKSPYKNQESSPHHNRRRTEEEGEEEKEPSRRRRSRLARRGVCRNEGSSATSSSLSSSERKDNDKRKKLPSRGRKKSLKSRKEEKQEEEKRGLSCVLREGVKTSSSVSDIGTSLEEIEREKKKHKERSSPVSLSTPSRKMKRSCSHGNDRRADKRRSRTRERRERRGRRRTHSVSASPLCEDVLISSCSSSSTPSISPSRDGHHRSLKKKGGGGEEEEDRREERRRRYLHSRSQLGAKEKIDYHFSSQVILPSRRSSHVKTYSQEEEHRNSPSSPTPDLPSNSSPAPNLPCVSSSSSSSSDLPNSSSSCCRTSLSQIFHPSSSSQRHEGASSSSSLPSTSFSSSSTCITSLHETSHASSSSLGPPTPFLSSTCASKGQEKSLYVIDQLCTLPKHRSSCTKESRSSHLRPSVSRHFLYKEQQVEESLQEELKRKTRIRRDKNKSHKQWSSTTEDTILKERTSSSLMNTITTGCSSSASSFLQGSLIGDDRLQTSPSFLSSSSRQETTSRQAIASVVEGGEGRGGMGEERQGSLLGSCEGKLVELKEKMKEQEGKEEEGKASSFLLSDLHADSHHIKKKKTVIDEGMTESFQKKDTDTLDISSQQLESRHLAIDSSKGLPVMLGVTGHPDQTLLLLPGGDLETLGKENGQIETDQMESLLESLTNQKKKKKKTRENREENKKLKDEEKQRKRDLRKKWILERCTSDLHNMKARLQQLKEGWKLNLIDVKQWMTAAFDEMAQVYIHSAKKEVESVESKNGLIAQLQKQLEDERAVSSCTIQKLEEDLVSLQLLLHDRENQLVLAQHTRERQEQLIEHLKTTSTDNLERQKKVQEKLQSEILSLKEKEADRDVLKTEEKDLLQRQLNDTQRELDEKTLDNRRLLSQVDTLTQERDQMKKEAEESQRTILKLERDLVEIRGRESIQRQELDACQKAKDEGKILEKELVEQLHAVNMTLNAKEDLLTETKREMERITQELETEKELRSLKEQEIEEKASELRGCRETEVTQSEKISDLEREVQRMQKVIQNLQEQEEQNRRQRGAEKSRLEKQLQDQEHEIKAIQEESAGRLRQHLEAEEKLREELHALKSHQRKKTSTDEELLLTKRELQTLKDELRDLLAEEVEKRENLERESERHREQSESRQHLIRSLLQQKSTLEVKLLHAQEEQAALKELYEKRDEEIRDLHRQIATFQHDLRQKDMQLQRNKLDDEKYKQEIQSLETTLKEHQEELLNRQEQLTDALNKHQISMASTKKWRCMYTSQQQELQQLRNQLLSLHKSLLQKGDNQDEILLLHLNSSFSRGQATSRVSAQGEKKEEGNEEEEEEEQEERKEKELDYEKEHSDDDYKNKSGLYKGQDASPVISSSSASSSCSPFSRGDTTTKTKNPKEKNTLSDFGGEDVDRQEGDVRTASPSYHVNQAASALIELLLDAPIFSSSKEEKKKFTARQDLLSPFDKLSGQPRVLGEGRPAVADPSTSSHIHPLSPLHTKSDRERRISLNGTSLRLSDLPLEVLLEPEKEEGGEKRREEEDLDLGDASERRTRRRGERTVSNDKKDVRRREQDCDEGDTEKQIYTEGAPRYDEDTFDSPTCNGEDLSLKRRVSRDGLDGEPDDGRDEKEEKKKRNGRREEGKQEEEESRQTTASSLASRRGGGEVVERRREVDSSNERERKKLEKDQGIEDRARERERGMKQRTAESGSGDEEEKENLRGNQERKWSAKSRGERRREQEEERDDYSNRCDSSQGESHREGVENKREDKRKKNNESDSEERFSTGGEERRSEKTAELMDIRRELDILRKEHDIHSRQKSQVEKSLFTLQGEHRRAEEELSRVTCTCEIAFHDILAQSHRYHTSARALQRIESAGENSSQIPLLRQDLYHFIQSRERGRDGGEKEERREKRRNQMYFTENEKRQVMEWMSYLVLETERACAILEGAHAARDLAARQRQELQGEVQRLSGMILSSQNHLGTLSKETSDYSKRIRQLELREHRCLKVLGFPGVLSPSSSSSSSPSPSSKKSKMISFNLDMNEKLQDEEEEKREEDEVYYKPQGERKSTQLVSLKKRFPPSCLKHTENLHNASLDEREADDGHERSLHLLANERQSRMKEESSSLLEEGPQQGGGGGRDWLSPHYRRHFDHVDFSFTREDHTHRPQNVFFSHHRTGSKNTPKSFLLPMERSSCASSYQTSYHDDEHGEVQSRDFSSLDTSSEGLFLKNKNKKEERDSMSPFSLGGSIAESRRCETENDLRLFDSEKSSYSFLQDSRDSLRPTTSSMMSTPSFGGRGGGGKHSRCFTAATTRTQISPSSSFSNDMESENKRRGRNVDVFLSPLEKRRHSDERMNEKSSPIFSQRITDDDRNETKDLMLLSPSSLIQASTGGCSFWVDWKRRNQEIEERENGERQRLIVTSN